MTPHATNFIIRSLILSAIIKADTEYFLKQSNPSGLKNSFKRLKDGLNTNIDAVFAQFDAKGQAEIRKWVTPDKIAAIQNIVSRLATMSDTDLSKLEDDIISITQVTEGEN